MKKYSVTEEFVLNFTTTSTNSNSTRKDREEIRRCKEAIIDIKTGERDATCRNRKFLDGIEIFDSESDVFNF